MMKYTNLKSTLHLFGRDTVRGIFIKKQKVGMIISLVKKENMLHTFNV